MRAKIKNKLVIDPCWEGIDFSSDKFAELDQEITMPDGKRRRRFSNNQHKRNWYARHRAIRFARRFGWGNVTS